MVEGRANAHLADKAILVHALALAPLGLLGPDLLDVLEDHVAVAVEGLDTREQFAAISAGDENLGVCAGGGLEERERAGGEFVVFNEGDFVFTEGVLLEVSCDGRWSEMCSWSEMVGGVGVRWRWI